MEEMIENHQLITSVILHKQKIHQLEMQKYQACFSVLLNQKMFFFFSC